MQEGPALPGGRARRTHSTGLRAGARRTRIRGPRQALGLVANELGEAEKVLYDSVHSDVAAVPAITRYLAAAGGKRLRPALCALGARAVGYTGPVSRLMAAGELIHLGSLLHDDVVDSGELRRGQPTANILHGNAVSVLAGDFCVSRALLMALECGAAAGTELARTVGAMSEGEVIQLQAAGNLDNDHDTYLAIVERKTSSLIAWCVSAGALGQEDFASAEALATYGRAVGVAFQITDDVLDFLPGTGKRPGNDLREKKVTLPLLLAMQRVSHLRDAMEGEMDDALVETLLRDVTKSGALEAALEVARTYVAAALTALEQLPDNEGREALEALASYLVERAQ